MFSPYWAMPGRAVPIFYCMYNGLGFFARSVAGPFVAGLGNSRLRLGNLLPNLLRITEGALSNTLPNENAQLQPLPNPLPNVMPNPLRALPNRLPNALLNTSVLLPNRIAQCDCLINPIDCPIVIGQCDCPIRGPACPIAIGQSNWAISCSHCPIAIAQYYWAIATGNWAIPLPNPIAQSWPAIGQCIAQSIAQ